MEAFRRKVVELKAIALFSAMLSSGALAEDSIRLPTWIEPTTEVTQATYRAAPRPKPLSIDRSHSRPAPREPNLLPSAKSDPARIVRQVEFAASEAKTRHALNRLIRRCKTAADQLQAAGTARQQQRVRQVASWAHHSLGRRDAAADQHASAVRRYEFALTHDPQNTDARHDLALSLVTLGDNAGALHAFSIVLQSDPNHLEARRNRANLHLLLGSPESAVADCDVVLQGTRLNDQAQVATLLLRGNALHASGRPREAAADFTGVLQIAPKHAVALRSRAHVFADEGLFDQALTDYAASLEAEPDSGETYRSFAWLLATCPDPGLRNPEVAVEAAYRARRLLGADAFLTLDASAAAHAAAGDFGEAIRFQQRAVMAADASFAAEASDRLKLYEAGQAFVAQRRVR